MPANLKPTETLMGQRIRQARLDKDWTQPQLATRMESNISDICFYERGHREPKMFALGNLCVALECSADWLLGLSDVRERR